MNTYKLRPGYGSNKLLIEFVHGPEKDTFFEELTAALKELALEIKAVDDLWMNDEMLLTIASSMGIFTFSKDIWDFAFIIAEDNQECILKIDSLLSQNSKFKKDEVDFDTYKNINNNES